MTPDFDLAIVGSGFGGSLLAMIARRLGKRVVLLERGRHPRFAIGESASPLAGVLIEQLADRYDLPRIRPLASYGEWQRQCPEIVCGLKRGFTYFKHERGARYEPALDRANQLLVAASPSDELSDTHWLRADVDHFLVREACALGVEYLEDCELDRVNVGVGRTAVGGRRHGQRMHVSARAIVDATGPGGFLSRALAVKSRGYDAYPPTQALFSHFVQVRRCGGAGCGGAERGGAGFEGAGAEGAPPYPPDDAALHHVFDGGWMWVLRFNNGVTSAGVAVTDALAAELGLADGGPAWQRLLARYPSIAEQFADAQPIREFTWLPRVARRAARAADSDWAMLPSAAAFVDPLFSTGIPMTLLGVERIAGALERGDFARGGAPAGTDESRVRTWAQEYERVTLAEADHTARFIGGCYASFPHFEAFTAWSMFYFAAASYSEMARRLGRPSSGFLVADDEAFVTAMRDSADRARAGTLTLDEVGRAIERMNIAGLCDASKQNWYGADPHDVVRGAQKLGVTAADVERVLTSLGVGVGSSQRRLRTTNYRRPTTN